MSPHFHFFPSPSSTLEVCDVSIRLKDSSKKVFTREISFRVKIRSLWIHQSFDVSPHSPLCVPEMKLIFHFWKCSHLISPQKTKSKSVRSISSSSAACSAKKCLSFMIILSVSDILRITIVNIMLIMIIVIMSLDRKEALEEVGLILSVYCCLPWEWGGERGECCRFSQTSFLTLRRKKYRYRHQSHQHCFCNIVDNQQCLQFRNTKDIVDTFCASLLTSIAYKLWQLMIVRRENH